MHREIASLKVKLKDKYERKASSRVKEVNTPQINAEYQFVGRNKKRASRGNLLTENLSPSINLVLSYCIFKFQSGAQNNPETKTRGG